MDLWQKDFFGSLRDFTACFNLSISVLTCESMIVESSFEWIRLDWRACKDWTILAKDVTCAIKVLIASFWWVWIGFVGIGDGLDQEFGWTGTWTNLEDSSGNDWKFGNN